MTRDQATENQIRAASPDLSTWLSANAGSGKTRVLTDRVARLLLGGVSPQNILCLTYTKAAASEMQNRLFQRLGEWAMKDDDALIAALDELGETGVENLAQARQLFARAIETPGGLKIQTIHSFCASLLRRFPLETGVSPQFVEMDERAAKILRDDVVETMSVGADRELVETLVRFFTGEDFSRLTQDIADHRVFFAKEHSEPDIWKWFGLHPGFCDADLAALAFQPDDFKTLTALVPLLLRGTATEVRAGNALLPLTRSPLTPANLPALESVFLFGSGAKSPFAAKLNGFPTKGLREGDAAHLIPALNDLMERVERARLERIGLYSAQKTLALHSFARGFLTEYEARKLRHGWLDFDDLIEKAGALLTEPSVAAWVLYRLDGGIDHILVDEAQDTSPAQWRVIDSLAQEFTTGESARQDIQRTIFVVGDPKQSIYSFQGADPAEFTRMKDAFGTRLGQIGQRLQNEQLTHSFRSSPAILNLVDFCLKDMPGLGETFLHRAQFLDKPGRVDLWPVVEKTEFKEDRKWHDPVDRPSPENHNVRLANQVANDIARVLHSETIQGKNEDARPVEPGDVMILVRKRSGGLFDQIIRACKEQALPIAGADRLRIGGELAVKDLTALLRFLATPEDDLSLAATLRSPLFGLSEGDIFDLAHDRGKGVYLWRALTTRQADFERPFQILRDLRDDADYLRPYDLLERMLTRHRGRANLLARLGAEAEDGIDALLSQALAYERFEAPSLTGFLMWLDAEDVTIKRQMDSAGNQIRVMTVHGAKGLESPIVILPDTAKTTPRVRGELVRLEAARVAWRPSSNESPQPVTDALTRRKEADQEEWTRLLYVAMTRAEQWLIIAAAGDVGSGQDSWYRILEAGLKTAGAGDHSFAGGQGQRYETGAWQKPTDRDPAQRDTADSELPGWAVAAASAPSGDPPILAPSALGGAKSLSGDVEGDSDAALRRGRQIHRLLEYLPVYGENLWDNYARSLLAFGEDSATDEEIVDLLDEVRAILSAPDLKFLFSNGTLAEIDISAALPELGGTRVHGAIDRLVIKPDSILAVDFKSNVKVPDKPNAVPEGILRQMGAYASALQSIYPDKTVETAILWTRTGKLMPLPNVLVIEALRRLDDPVAGS